MKSCQRSGTTFIFCKHNMDDGCWFFCVGVSKQMQVIVGTGMSIVCVQIHFVKALLLFFNGLQIFFTKSK